MERPNLRVNVNPASLEAVNLPTDLAQQLVVATAAILRVRGEGAASWAAVAAKSARPLMGSLADVQCGRLRLGVVELANRSILATGSSDGPTCAASPAFADTLLSDPAGYVRQATDSQWRFCIPLDQDRAFSAFTEVEWVTDRAPQVPLSDAGPQRVLGTLFGHTYEQCVLQPARQKAQLLAPLSQPQREVTILLLEGLTEAQIADKLQRNRHTLHDQVRSVYAVFGVSSRLELIVKWHQAMKS